MECPVEGDSGIEIHRVAKIESAGPGDVTFFAASKYAAALAETKASAVIAGANAPGAPCAVIRSASPYLTFARALQVLSPPAKPEPGVHKLACIAEGAVVDSSATVGAYVVIERGVRIGAGTVIHPHVVIGAESVIGPDCVVHANVSIRERCVLGARVVVQNGAVIGSDGYGFAQRPDGSHEKIPQIGSVHIEDDVEIGANTTIDRPALGATVIKSGVKIDNLVQVAHGVVIGHHSLLAAQVGIAGTTTIGNHVMFGGQSGVSGHLTIGDRVRVAAKTAIIASIDPDVSMSGHPMMETSEWRRAHVVVRKLPEMRKQLIALEDRLAALEEKKK